MVSIVPGDHFAAEISWMKRTGTEILSIGSEILWGLMNSCGFFFFCEDIRDTVGYIIYQNGFPVVFFRQIFTKKFEGDIFLGNVLERYPSMIGIFHSPNGEIGYRGAVI